MRRIVLCTLLSAVAVTFVWRAEGQTRTIEDYLQRSRELYESGKYRQAERELQSARSSATFLRHSSPVVCGEVDFLAAMCRAKLGNGAAELREFVTSNPSSPYINEALLALGGEEYEWGDWQRAVESFERVDMKRLSDEQAEELCFECGHSYYHLEEWEKSREWLLRMSRPGEMYNHSRYLLGYMAYREEQWMDARNYFSSLKNVEDYAPVLPYYMLNVESRLGNDRYVAANAESVLDGVAGSRRGEIYRCAAQSAFALEEWSDVVRHLESMKEEGESLSREENYMVGYSLYRLKKWERAAAYLRGACGAEDSLTRNASYHLADCLLRWGDKRGAMHCFSMAYAGGEDGVMKEDAHYNYCKLQVELGGSNFNEEIQSLSSYLRSYPRSTHRAEIEGYLVSACYAANDLKGAYATLKEFEGAGGRVRAAMQSVAYYYAAECYARGEMAESEEYCNYALDYKEYDEEIFARTLFLLGEIDYSLGRYKQAASMYDQYLMLETTHHKEYYFALYNMGYANFNSSRFQSAYEDFREFTAERTVRDSFWADAYNRMGDAKAATKEYAAAARLYGASASTDTPERFYGAYRVAMMEGMAGNVMGRVEALEKIVEQGKGNYVTRAHYELGNTLLSAGEYPRAVKVLEDYTARYGSSRDYVAALGDLGLAYRNVGRNEDALATYKKIVGLTRGSREAHNALGEIRNIYIENGNVDGYFEYADREGMNSDLGSVQRDSLSFVAAQRLYIGGDKGAASAAFDKYITENPEGIYSAAALYYSADCHTTLGDSLAARERLTRLTAMYYNNYTQRGYERLAQLSAAGADWRAAAEAYAKLADIATNSAERVAALERYLDAAEQSGDAAVVVAVADKVMAHPEATESLVRKARFAKAGALEAQGKRNPAVAIYSALSEDVSTPEGAESFYKIIDTAFKYGSFEKAESLVYEFAEKNTPHAYWLAKSFLLLGDVYTSRGDLFQARATYQSVVDGYSNTTDGIIDAARERVASLGDNQ